MIRQGSIRHAHFVLSLALCLPMMGPPSRANFVRITVDRPAGARVRAIWRPYAGAMGPDAAAAQQAAIRHRNLFATNADSAARWRDEAARDTAVHTVPVEFVVDMTGGPVVVESLTSDSVRVAAQLTPQRGPRVEAWGRAMVIESDGRTPGISRRR